MDWREFKALLSGISPDTALGRVVAIRAETDKDIIKSFSPGQAKIYNDWQLFRIKNRSDEDMLKDFAALESVIFNAFS